MHASSDTLLSGRMGIRRAAGERDGLVLIHYSKEHTSRVEILSAAIRLSTKAFTHPSIDFLRDGDHDTGFESIRAQIEQQQRPQSEITAGKVVLWQNYGLSEVRTQSSTSVAISAVKVKRYKKED